jgi:hypothetical protein
MQKPRLFDRGFSFWYLYKIYYSGSEFNGKQKITLQIP